MLFWFVLRSCIVISAGFYTGWMCAYGIITKCILPWMIISSDREALCMVLSYVEGEAAVVMADEIVLTELQHKYTALYKF